MNTVHSTDQMLDATLKFMKDKQTDLKQYASNAFVWGGGSKIELNEHCRILDKPYHILVLPFKNSVHII